jgi:hypothetical protein
MICMNDCKTVVATTFFLTLDFVQLYQKRGRVADLRFPQANFHRFLILADQVCTLTDLAIGAISGAEHVY